MRDQRFLPFWCSPAGAALPSFSRLPAHPGTSRACSPECAVRLLALGPAPTAGDAHERAHETTVPLHSKRRDGGAYAKTRNKNGSSRICPSSLLVGTLTARLQKIRARADGDTLTRHSLCLSHGAPAI